MLSQETLYVAEVHIPAEVYTKPGFKSLLPRPEAFGVSKGYWTINFEADKFETLRATGILLTSVELFFKSHI